MIQFNLLPDVKLEYIRAERSKRLVVLGSLIVSAVAIGVLLILLSYSGLQKKHLKDLSSDINRETNSLKSSKDINTILTVQNQLNSLTGLHNTKPAASRLFDYLNQLTPAKITISSFSVDYSLYTITLSGSADSVSSVNQYVDTLKLTTYSAGKSTDTPNAFSNVVLSSFSLASAKGDTKGSSVATYSITAAYDKTIFDITQPIALNVPSVDTRAQAQNPTDLFQALPSGGKK